MSGILFLALVNLALAIWVWYDAKSFRGQDHHAWTLLVVFLGFIGLIIYLAAGRKSTPDAYNTSTRSRTKPNGGQRQHTSSEKDGSQDVEIDLSTINCTGCGKQNNISNAMCFRCGEDIRGAIGRAVEMHLHDMEEAMERSEKLLSEGEITEAFNTAVDSMEQEDSLRSVIESHNLSEEEKRLNVVCNKHNRIKNTVKKIVDE